MNINADNDFSEIVDELETLTLLRRGGDSLVLSGARRVALKRTEQRDTAGGLIASSWVWDIPWPDGQSPPALGDKLKDDAGCFGFLVAVDSLQPGQRFRCQARGLALHQPFEVNVVIEQALWQDPGSGPEITGWEVLLPAVNARIQPVSFAVDHDQSPPQSEKQFDIILEYEGELDENHRILGPDGAEYRIDRFLSAQALGDLPVVEATRLTAAS